MQVERWCSCGFSSKTALFSEATERSMKAMDTFKIIFYFTRLLEKFQVFRFAN